MSVSPGTDTDTDSAAVSSDGPQAWSCTVRMAKIWLAPSVAYLFMGIVIAYGASVALLAYRVVTSYFRLNVAPVLDAVALLCRRRAMGSVVRFHKLHHVAVHFGPRGAIRASLEATMHHDTVVLLWLVIPVVLGIAAVRIWRTLR